MARGAVLFINYSSNITARQAIARAARARISWRNCRWRTITIMGVPPGRTLRHRPQSRRRVGRRRASRRFARAATNAIVAWPTNSSGFVLRQESLPATNWSAATSVRGIVGGVQRDECSSAEQPLLPTEGTLTNVPPASCWHFSLYLLLPAGRWRRCQSASITRRNLGPCCRSAAEADVL
jgi:hypothetical protein